ncbi:MAG: CopA family copper-resistance protein [Cognaticolwellia sp.]|jgi:CopA family copper-resistance protein|uniref:copper resistance system multicopper oxidase n=1 Tax=Colwellia polaris TaxID=326537 RepID=UPI000A16D8C9|nr:copper resistance system multicopper oxidase [Colwellia polaris]|tara:strand:+ start:285 stop:2018 length:1734 start_codon:yes stop_codon:yes gene_type:complete
MSEDKLAFKSRRMFVKGVAATAFLSTLPLSAFYTWADSNNAELSGRNIHLNIGEKEVNITGQQAAATLVNGLLPGPVLRLKEGDDVTIMVTNNLSEMTTIHWHGIILEPEMDGVPGISFPGIEPGETFTYKFKLKQHGTYWYHAHTLAEQTGVYGALVIEPKDSLENEQVDKDFPIVLSDWTDENPVDVFLNLKKMGGYYNYQQLTAVDFIDDVANVGFAAAMNKRVPWNKARMSPTDFSDITASTYTYLVNGASPNANWHGEVKQGDKVRLRFIGAATSTFFDVRIPGLKLKIVATDGQKVHPVLVDEFRVGPGETYDAIVEIKDASAYSIFAQSMDRSGFASATLSANRSDTAIRPELDEPALLTMLDMMGDMNGNIGTMSDMKDMPMDGKTMSKPSLKTASKEVRHASTEYGPGVDMRVNMPRTNLDDPGPGLRDTGRKALTYADLKSVHLPEDTRIPSREIEMHLTGNMERFIWSIDGLKLNEAKPLHFPLGERIRVILHNDSNMLHPMHLHGMWSDLESPEGEFQVRKHTITVQPAQRVSFLVTVDAPGRWAFHCHLLYHMAAGMFREVVVA